MCSAFRKIFFLLAFCTACFNIFAASAFARTGMHHGGPDSPHNTTNGISCDSCHSLTSTDPKLILDNLDFGTNIDDTRYNSLCWSCHVSGGDAPYVSNHSSLNTSDRYGNWTVECWVCHSQHAQEEINLYPDALLYSGVADNVAVTAATITVTDNEADWPTAADDNLVGMRIIPNTLDDVLRHWNYKIVSNTATTLTVDRLSDTSDTSAFQIGNTFGLYLGKLMPEYLRLVWITNPGEEKSGKPYPKLFRREGANSYANGDVVYDGICEVCHTMTNHFRNDGAADDQLHTNLTVQPVAGTNCIRCHRHENGVAHSGGPGTGCVTCHGHDAGSSYDPDMSEADGGVELTGTDHPGYGTAQSHSTHTETSGDDLKGPAIYCDTCHLIDSIPFFKSGTDANGDGRFDLNETDVCDACHSRGGTYDGIDDTAIGVKKIWQTGAYVATDDSTLRSGKEKWCAGCHDEDPSNSKADGSGVIAPNVIGDEDGPYAYGMGWGYYKNGHGLARGVYPASGAPCYGINTAASLSRRVMNTSAIGWVNMLCEFGDAKVVTNSTHNKADATMSVRDLKGDLINWGLKKEYFHENWHTRYAIDLFDRHVAIQHWLDENGDHEWVCFDDYFFKDDPRLVVVDMNDGITYNNFATAAKLFGLEKKLSFLI